MKDPFDYDHPCKGTCSGWAQGFEKGAALMAGEVANLKDNLALTEDGIKEDQKKWEKMRAVVEAARALYGDLCAHDEQPTHCVSWVRLSEAIADISGESK